MANQYTDKDQDQHRSEQGNTFKNNPEKAREEGRKGGEKSRRS